MKINFTCSSIRRYHDCNKVMFILASPSICLYFVALRPAVAACALARNSLTAAGSRRHVSVFREGTRAAGARSLNMSIISGLSIQASGRPAEAVTRMMWFSKLPASHCSKSR